MRFIATSSLAHARSGGTAYFYRGGQIYEVEGGERVIIKEDKDLRGRDRGGETAAGSPGSVRRRAAPAGVAR